MKKKTLIFSILLSFFAFSSFAKTGFEFGIGSGYIFYGDDDEKDLNKSIENANQVVLCTNAALLIPANDFVIFALGGDSVSDFRWHGSNHLNRVDYAFLAGFRVYPNFAGLFLSADYALGRRTAFVSTASLDKTRNTKWGNGFKFALGYDFSYHLSGIAPILEVSLKSMPRGSSRDNLLCVSLKLTKHK